MTAAPAVTSRPGRHGTPVPEEVRGDRGEERFARDRAEVGERLRGAVEPVRLRAAVSELAAGRRGGDGEEAGGGRQEPEEGKYKP